MPLHRTATCEMCADTAEDQCVHCLQAERDRLREELTEAHNWLLAYDMCDCDDRDYEGKVRCRFAEALRDVR